MALLCGLTGPFAQPVKAGRCRFAEAGFNARP
jgi:hypothetical protein